MGTEMPRKVGRPKTVTKTYRTVRIETRLAGMAKLVAKHLNVSEADLLSGMLDGPIEKAYAEMVRDLPKV
jgi:hypothetical protein